MKAAELIKTMDGSERLIVRDRLGNELYRGFKRLVDFHPEMPWMKREIRRTQLHTEIFRRDYEGRYKHKKNMSPVTGEEAGVIKYRDIEEHIYILIEVMAV